MNTLTRKQREIQQRERQILELARRMLLEEGYHGLSMDRIAEALEYSKGTIYQHFGCKEEILVALATEAMERRLQLFRRAAAFRGRPRERMSAIGMACELFYQLLPHHFQIEHAVRLSSVYEKTSEQRRRLFEMCETNCMGVAGGVIRDGIAAGDLTLPPGFEPEQLGFGLWAATFGGYSILATSPSLAHFGINTPVEALRENCNRLMDGFGWRPLSTELDLEKLIERIAAEVFSEEFAQLAAAR